MEKKDYMQKAFEMILRLQSGCSPIVWSLEETERGCVVTLVDASQRSIERLMNDEIRDLPMCFFFINDGKFKIRLG